MTSERLPEWPGGRNPHWSPAPALEHEKKVSAYWEARARAAVMLLEDIASGEVGINSCIKNAKQTIEAIGPLPPEKP